MTTAPAQSDPSAPPPSSPASKARRPLHKPRAVSSILLSNPQQARQLISQVEARLLSLPLHQIARLSDPVLPLVGIPDPVAWLGQSEWLSESLLDLLLPTPRDGRGKPLGTRPTLDPRYARVLTHLTTTQRMISDVDNACRYVVRLAATDYLHLIASQDVEG